MTKVKRVRVILLTGLIVLCFVLGAGLVGCRGEQKTAEEQAEPGPALSSPVKIPNPYTGPAFCWIGGYPAAAEQILRLSKVITGASHGQNPHKQSVPEADLITAVLPFQRMFIVVLDGVQRGLEEGRELISGMEAFRLSAIGQDYMSVLTKEAVIDPEAILRRLPSVWVQANFQIKVLEMDEKEAERLHPMTREQWEKLEGAVATGEGKVPETGLVFPRSGFFEPFDDAYLFDLKEGEISRPIKTGLGLAFVLVKEKKELTDAEKNDFLEKVRGDLGVDYLNKRVTAAMNEAEPGIKREAFRAALVTELSSGSKDERAVVWEWNDFTLTYGTWREISQTNMGLLKGVFDSSTFVTNMEAELRSFGARIVLGREALERGYTRFEEKWSKAAYDFYLRHLYALTMEKISAEVREKVPVPTEEEVKNHYQADIARFSEPAVAGITYLASPVAGSLNETYNRLKEGKVTLESLEGGSLQKTPHGKQSVHRAEVTQGGSKLRDIQPDLFSMKIGEMRIIKGTAQDYLVRLDALAKAKVKPFTAVAEQVKRDLYGRRLQDGMRAYLDSLEEKYPLRYNENEVDKGIKAPPRQDMS